MPTKAEKHTSLADTYLETYCGLPLFQHIDIAAVELAPGNRISPFVLVENAMADCS